MFHFLNSGYLILRRRLTYGVAKGRLSTSMGNNNIFFYFHFFSLRPLRTVCLGLDSLSGRCQPYIYIIYHENAQIPPVRSPCERQNILLLYYIYLPSDNVSSHIQYPYNLIRIFCSFGVSVRYHHYVRSLSVCIPYWSYYCYGHGLHCSDEL